jgi:hypothetical protein
VAKPVFCGQCKEPMKKGEKLKAHWRDKHPEDYTKRMLWLGESEAKIKSAMILASEGMKGPGQPASFGPEHYFNSKLSGSILLHGPVPGRAKQDPEEEIRREEEE